MDNINKTLLSTQQRANEASNFANSVLTQRQTGYNKILNTQTLVRQNAQEKTTKPTLAARLGNSLADFGDTFLTAVGQGFQQVGTSIAEMLIGASATGLTPEKMQAVEQIARASAENDLTQKLKEKVYKKGQLEAATDDAWAKNWSETAQKLYYGTIQGVGQMVPSMLAGNEAGMGIMLAEAFAGGQTEALNAVDKEGNHLATFDEATLYGAINAGVELATEKMFGGIKVGGKTYGSLENAVEKGLSRFTNGVGKKVAQFTVDALGEGVEEFVSGIVEPYAAKLIYDENQEVVAWRDDNGNINYNMDAFMSAVEEGVIGSLTAVALNTTTASIGKTAEITQKAFAPDTYYTNQTLKALNQSSESVNGIELNYNNFDRALKHNEQRNTALQEAQDSWSKISDKKKAKLLQENKGLADFIDENGNFKDTKFTEDQVKSISDFAKQAKETKGSTTNNFTIGNLIDLAIDPETSGFAKYIANPKSLNSEQKASIKFMNENFPDIKVAIVDEQAMKDGNYDIHALYAKKSDIILISSQNGSVLNSQVKIGHETTHSSLTNRILAYQFYNSKTSKGIIRNIIKSGYKNGYTEIQEFVDLMKSGGYIEGIDSKGNLIKKTDISDEVFEQETIATFIETVFNGKNNATLLYKLAQKRASFLQKIKNYIQAKKYNISTKENEFYKDYKEELDEIVDKIDFALENKSLSERDFVAKFKKKFGDRDIPKNEQLEQKETTTEQNETGTYKSRSDDEFEEYLTPADSISGKDDTLIQQKAKIEKDKNGEYVVNFGTHGIRYQAKMNKDKSLTVNQEYLDKLTGENGILSNGFDYTDKKTGKIRHTKRIPLALYGVKFNGYYTRDYILDRNDSYDKAYHKPKPSDILFTEFFLHPDVLESVVKKAIELQEKFDLPNNQVVVKYDYKTGDITENYINTLLEKIRKNWDRSDLFLYPSQNLSELNLLYAENKVFNRQEYINKNYISDKLFDFILEKINDSYHLNFEKGVNVLPPKLLPYQLQDIRNRAMNKKKYGVPEVVYFFNKESDIKQKLAKYNIPSQNVSMPYAIEINLAYRNDFISRIAKTLNNYLKYTVQIYFKLGKNFTKYSGEVSLSWDFPLDTDDNKKTLQRDNEKKGLQAQILENIIKFAEKGENWGKFETSGLFAKYKYDEISDINNNNYYKPELFKILDENTPLTRNLEKLFKGELLNEEQYKGLTSEERNNIGLTQLNENLTELREKIAQNYTKEIRENNNGTNFYAQDPYRVFDGDFSQYNKKETSYKNKNVYFSRTFGSEDIRNDIDRYYQLLKLGKKRTYSEQKKTEDLAESFNNIEVDVFDEKEYNKMVEESIKSFDEVTEKLDDSIFEKINKEMEVIYGRVGLRKSLRYTNGGTKESIRELFSDLCKSKKFGTAESVAYCSIVKNVEGCIKKTGSDGTRLLKNEFVPTSIRTLVKNSVLKTFESETETPLILDICYTFNDPSCFGSAEIKGLDSKIQLNIASENFYYYGWYGSLWDFSGILAHEKFHIIKRLFLKTNPFLNENVENFPKLNQIYQELYSYIVKQSWAETRKQDVLAINYAEYKNYSFEEMVCREIQHDAGFYDLLSDKTPTRIKEIVDFLNNNHEPSNNNNKFIHYSRSLRTDINEFNEKAQVKYVAKAEGDKYLNFTTAEDLVDGIAKKLFGENHDINARSIEEFAEDTFKLLNLNTERVKDLYIGLVKGNLTGTSVDTLDAFTTKLLGFIEKQTAYDIAKNMITEKNANGDIEVNMDELRDVVYDQLVDTGIIESKSYVWNDQVGWRPKFTENAYNTIVKPLITELIQNFYLKGTDTKQLKLKKYIKQLKQRILGIYETQQIKRNVLKMRGEIAKVGKKLNNPIDLNAAFSQNQIFKKFDFSKLKSGEITRYTAKVLYDFAKEFFTDKNPDIADYLKRIETENEDGTKTYDFEYSRYYDLLKSLEVLDKYYAETNIASTHYTQEYVDAMRALAKGLNTLTIKFDEIFVQGKAESISKLSQEAVDDLKTARVVSGGSKTFWGRMMNSIKKFFTYGLTPKAAVTLFASGNTNNPIVKALNSATRAKYRATALLLNSTEKVKDYIWGKSKEAKEYRKYYENERIYFKVEDAEIETKTSEKGNTSLAKDSNGVFIRKGLGTFRTINLSIGQAMSLIGLATQREDVENGFLKGGFNYEDENGVVQHVNSVTIDEINALRDELLKKKENEEFFNLILETLDNLSQKAKEQDINLNDKTNKKVATKFGVEYDGYFPIIRDRRMVNENFASWQKINQTIYNIGWNKSRVKNTRGLEITDALFTMFKVADIMSIYAEMGAELDLLGKLAGRKYVNENGVGESIINAWDDDYDTSMKNSPNAKKKKSNYVEKYMNDLMTDFVHQRRTDSTATKTLEWLRKNYIRAAYGLNISIVLSQFSAFPMSLAYIDTDITAKAFNAITKEKKLNNEMMKYSAVAQVRYNKYSSYMMETLSNNVVEKYDNAMDKTMAGMTWTDMQVVNYLWNCAKMQVAKNHNMKVEDINLEKDVGLRNEIVDLFEDTVIDTQGGSSAGEKSSMQRSTSELTKTLTIGKGDAVKKFSILVSSIAQAKYAYDFIKAKNQGKVAVVEELVENEKNQGKNVSKEEATKQAQEQGKIVITESQFNEYQKSAKKLNKAVIKGFTAIITSNIFFALLKQLVSLLLNKDDKDKDGNEISAIEAMSINFTSSMLGMIPFGSEIYSYFAQGYDFEGYSYSMINDALKSIQNLYTICTTDASEAKIASTLRSTIYAVASFLGMPVKNATNLVTGVISRFSEEFKYSWNDLFDTTKSYVSDIEKANESGDTNLANHILELYMTNKGVETSSSTMTTIASLYQKGYTNVLPKAVSDTITYNNEEYTLSKKEKKRFKEIYNQAEKSVSNLTRYDLFQKASDKTKSKAIKMVYDYYYTLAVHDYIDDGTMSKNELFAEIIPIEKLAVIIQECKAVESDGKNNSKKIQIMRIIDKQNLTNAQKYMILGYLGYSNDAGYSQVATVINKYITKDYQKEMLEYCGYDVA